MVGGVLGICKIDLATIPPTKVDFIVVVAPLVVTCCKSPPLPPVLSGTNKNPLVSITTGVDSVVLGLALIPPNIVELACGKV